MDTYVLSTRLSEPDGTPIVGATVTARLSVTDYTVTGVVLPVRVVATSDALGDVELTLASNLDGTQNSLYEITISAQGAVRTSVVIQMPQANTSLEQLVDVLPITTSYTTAAAISAAIAQDAAEDPNVVAVAGALGTITTVATNIANVNTVAGVSANVTTVAGISANVTTVAGAAANISTVATNVANVNTVAGISANVTSVATNSANINTVAAANTNITTVATNIANVNTVAGANAAVTTVATNIANVNTVVTNVASVNTVAGNVANVNTVAGISANVTSVASNSANINTVATNIASVNTVATNVAATTTVATNIANVNTVSTNIADVGLVADDIADVNLVADDIESVTTVAGKMSDVTAVATNSANINTVAAANANITTVATNIANVNTVAGISANVTTVAGISAAVVAAPTHAATATTQAGIATTQANIATTQAGLATTARVGSEAARDAAIAIVYGGTYSINAAAGNVPIADTDARLGNDWLHIGTDPNEVPLNQFLGGMAYQNPNNVTIGGGSATLTSLTATTVTGTSMVYNGTELNARLNPLAQAVSVQMTASATVGGIQQLDNINLDMGTNDFTLEFDELLPTTRPTADIVLDRKHDGTNGYILSLLTTGIVRLQINGFSFDSTVALASATNVNPKLQVPVIRETATVAGSVTFYSNGVILGVAVAILASGTSGVEKVTNGNFATDITGWTLNGGGTITWSSGKMAVERVTSNTAGVQAITLTAGETVLITGSCAFVSGLGTADCRLNLTTSATVGTNIVASQTYENNAAGSFSFVYSVPTSGTYYVQCETRGAAGIYDFDDISVLTVSTVSVNNTSARIINGTTTTRTAGSLQASRLFNRALDAPTVLDYTINGPALAERGANQTELFSNSTFDSDTTGWAAKASATLSWDAAGRAEVNITGSGGGIVDSQILSLTLGKLYLITANTVAGTYVGDLVLIIGNVPSQNLTASANTKFSFVYTATAANPTIEIVRNSAATGTIYVDNFSIKQTGVTSELLASNAQSDTGQIFDTSGNKNHARLPASGATVVGRPVSQTREVRWTNTWSATSELQYVGGVNQAIFPLNHYIESLVVIPEGATLTGFTIGDGSNASYYGTVNGTITSGVAIYVQLDRRVTDGTNRKLTITPMGAFTGNINTTLVGTELERK